MENQLELLHFNSEEVEDILDVEVIRLTTVSVHEEGIDYSGPPGEESQAGPPQH